MQLNNGDVINYKGEFYDVKKHLKTMKFIFIKRWVDGFENTITEKQLELHGYVKSGDAK